MSLTPDSDVVELVLNRPDKLNAVSGELVEGLTAQEKRTPSFVRG